MANITGATHFTKMRFDYAAMIPEPLPNGMWVIYATGIFEILGAISLLIARLHRISAGCLALLVVVMTPANIYASLHQIEFRGGPPTNLYLRLGIQLIYIVLLVWIARRNESRQEPD